MPGGKLIARLKGRRRVAAAMCGPLAVLVFAAVALAVIPDKGHYTGLTDQNRAMTLNVNKKHRIKRMTIDWKAPCKKNGGTYGGSTKDVDGKSDKIKQPGDGSFSDKGSYTENAGSYKGHIKVELGGQFTKPKQANGFFDVHVRVTLKGQTVNNCHKKVHWHIP